MPDTLAYTLSITDLTKEDELWPDYQLAEPYRTPPPTGPLADIVTETLRSSRLDRLTAANRIAGRPFTGGKVVVRDDSGRKG